MEENRKFGFDGCEIEYNVDPPEQHGVGRDRVYGPFLERFMSDDDAITVMIKADNKRQASNIATGLRQSAISRGYHDISVRQVNGVCVFVSKEKS